ncbi:MAG: adenylate/guanylate cyclase domain-containing protein [Alphaproteobacteria bacterium]|nr:adenylate/guanylate cyclase domain-containing protein [Alphaproteobacteria bacterium]MCB9693207.1 adenylate/guanylate cyclase domain-containing protein [Alphaproteobacteria bacterium]
MKFEITTQGVVDRDVAWKVLGDTDGMNRVAGGSVVVSRVEHTPEGPVVSGEMVGPMGMRMPFRETGGWVDRRWFRQDRVFSAGPLNASKFLLELLPEGEGVRPRITLALEGPVAFRPLLSANARRIRSAWQGVLDELPPPGGKLVRHDNGITGELKVALERWRPDVDRAVFGAFERYMSKGSALELQSMRPFELADTWGLDREAVLVGMLRGVKAGVFELYWSVRCMRCHGEVSSSTSLSDIADHAGCPSCDLDFDNDLSTNVEVLFAPHPGVLPRVEQSFCSFFPAGAPEIKGAVVVPPGGHVSESVVLGTGRFTLGADGVDVEVRVGPRGERRISWKPGVTGAVDVGVGRIDLDLHNPGKEAARVVLIADDRGLDAVPAALLTSLPEFRREMSDQVLGPDVRISNRRVCLLFTDLSGSTAMFEALGDAKAYGIVAEHFRLLAGVIEAHRGVLVKTIGDAVMASFHSVLDGFDAALEMRRAFDAWTATLDLPTRPRLNVGLHAGPALVVHSDAHGLDYFGRTVNLAARAQSASVDGQLTVTEAVLEHPVVAARCVAMASEEVVQHLKGIGEVRLLKIRPPEG